MRQSAKAFKQDSVGRGANISGPVQHSHQYSVTGKDGTVYSSFELKTINTKPSTMPKAMIFQFNDKNTICQKHPSRYWGDRKKQICGKPLDEVVYSILYISI